MMAQQLGHYNNNNRITHKKRIIRCPMFYKYPPTTRRYGSYSNIDSQGIAKKMYKHPNHGLIHYFIFFIFVSCLFTLPIKHASALESVIANGDSLGLFGISVHNELRNDIYVGALFSSDKVNKISKLLNPEISKRMSLKFVSKYSSRKMARFWKQRIAMNNPKSEWQPMTEEIVKFTGIFKRTMEVGDELNLDFDPESGTSVYLNGTLFLTIPKLNFYNLLLKVWIGAIPPTKNFKTGISGKNNASENDKLISQYENLQPIPGRFDDDKIVEKEPTIEIAKSEPKKTQAKKQTKQPKKTKETEKKVATKKNDEKSTKQNTLTKKSKSEKETDKIVSQLRADLALPKTALETVKPSIEIDNPMKTDLDFQVDNSINTKITTEQPSQEENQPVTEQKTNTKKLPLEKEPGLGSELELGSEPGLRSDLEPGSGLGSELEPGSEPDKEEKVALLDTPPKLVFDVDLYSGSYTRELVAQIRKIQWYPEKALVAEEQGEVKIQVTIDKNGAVIDKKITQRSGSRTLDRAALKMVGKAQPFPSIPEELGEEQFEFEVPLNFALQN